MAKATLINALMRRQRPYRISHPLAIPRTALAIDLMSVRAQIPELAAAVTRPPFLR